MWMGVEGRRGKGRWSKRGHGGGERGRGEGKMKS